VLTYLYDSTSIRRPFDCLSKLLGHSDIALAADPVTAVTVTYLFI